MWTASELGEQVEGYRGAEGPGGLVLVYLSTCYIFKAGVLGGSPGPSVLAGMGLENFAGTVVKDEPDLARVWIPVDLVCFLVPLHLKFPR